MSRWNTDTPGPPRIKICGLQTTSDVDAAVDAGADAVGFVLAEDSPRTVSPSQATRLADHAGDRVAIVMLLADAPPDMDTIAQDHWLQLHGNESNSRIRQAASVTEVIRAVPWHANDAIRELDADPHISRLLIDGPHGGSGMPFNHQDFAAIAGSLQTPWILAGGLNPDTVGAAISTLRPWGVDVSSGVESSLGIKDPARIAAFCDAVRAASG